MSYYPHTPGSKQAVADGCLCPVIDNDHGKGAFMDKSGEMLFWMNSECPVHVEQDDTQQKDIA